MPARYARRAAVADGERAPLGPPAPDDESSTRCAGGNEIPAEGAAEAVWAASDPYATALRTGRGPLYLRRTDGWLLPLEVERWCAGADDVDRAVLDRCEGAVLDVGCGPGRLVAELAAQGRTVLGVDVSEAAVTRTITVGGQALRRSVFDPLPGEGRWGTVLLMDGNIGIGGDPAVLLHRMAQLLAPGGLLIAETVPLDVEEHADVQVVAHGREAVGAPFPWVRIGTPALLRLADRAAGWRPEAQWTAGDRRFVALRTRTTSSSAEPPKSTAVISSQRARKTPAD
ncbi:bifunctional 2-polyprenyl-6-hydroxyphenol methylase/3-demethylubiquinol 3-O-methyltransferase UbiG [Streptomyces sp. Ag109_G2-15]|uniref:class I SAM-dependent methyltransferase n=1 Tax=Streptomyces sp. Ag109_G2-15 TaxID=1938850 RepID=UPI000BE27B9A|nr:class I SAM-dependent methyltransferase [Streptomyces sp. Ag109_G2-15]